MEMEYKIRIGENQIDFELDNIPFTDGQHLSETCVLSESPHNSSFQEESDSLQFSAELH